MSRINKTDNKIIDTRANKVSRIGTFIASMKVGEEAKLTNIAKKIGMHPNTIRDKLDEYQGINEAGRIRIVRNGEKIVRIERIEDKDESADYKKEIRDFLASLLNNICELRKEVEELKKKKR